LQSSKNQLKCKNARFINFSQRSRHHAVRNEPRIHILLRTECKFVVLSYAIYWFFYLSYSKFIKKLIVLKI